MKKILVLSDSHGNLQKLQKIIDVEWPFDHLIHCGDGVGDLEDVVFPEKVFQTKVSGNVDTVRFSGMDRFDYNEIGGLQFVVVHGDIFNVKADLSEIRNFAIKEDVGLICFGHTHSQYLENGFPVLFNPGAVNEGMYGVVEVAKTVEYLKKSLSL